MRRTMWVPERIERRVEEAIASVPKRSNGKVSWSTLVCEALEEYLAARAITSQAEGPTRMSLVQVERALRVLRELQAALVRQAAARDSIHRNQASLLEAPLETEDP